jgi:hypothetical protein
LSAPVAGNAAQALGVSIKKEYRLPNRFKQAGFSPIIIGYSGFHAIKPEIGKNVFKNAPFRPVAGNRLKSEYARIEFRLPF